MSRVAKAPVKIPLGVEVCVQGRQVSVKGSKGSLTHVVHSMVSLEVEGDELKISPVQATQAAVALAGTTRALLANMVHGVTTGFERKLQLVGVGYRAQMKGASLSLSLGHSHPIDYPVPSGITIETPIQTEVVIRGIDRQVVGQVAAEIRAFRPPEPYKGKGVKYSDEVVVRKEAKKK